MAVPLLLKKIVTKHAKKFKRPQSDRKICLEQCNCIQCLTIAGELLDASTQLPLYSEPLPASLSQPAKTAQKLCQTHPKRFVLHNPADFELLMMHNRTCYDEITHNVSARKQKPIVERVAQLDMVAHKL